jgi:hypothetical protein
MPLLTDLSGPDVRMYDECIERACQPRVSGRVHDWRPSRVELSLHSAQQRDMCRARLSTKNTEFPPFHLSQFSLSLSQFSLSVLSLSSLSQFSLSVLSLSSLSQFSLSVLSRPKTLNFPHFISLSSLSLSLSLSHHQSLSILSLNSLSQFSLSILSLNSLSQFSLSILSLSFLSQSHSLPPHIVCMQPTTVSIPDEPYRVHGS